MSYPIVVQAPVLISRLGERRAPRYASPVKSLFVSIFGAIQKSACRFQQNPPEGP